MTKAKDQERLCDAYHEAGHIASAWLAGASVHEARIGSQMVEGVGEVAGQARIDNYPNFDARIATMLAGPLAELRFSITIFKPRDLQFDAGARIDWAKHPYERFAYGTLRIPFNPQTAKEFSDALMIIAEGLKLDEKGAQSHFQHVFDQVLTLMNRSAAWSLVEAIAKPLSEKGELSEEEVVAICSRHSPREAPEA